MTLTARLLTLLAVFLCGAGCAQFAAPSSPAPATAVETAPPVPLTPLAPSPRLIVGRILAVDAKAGFAFIDLAPDAPRAALDDGAELTVRTLDLHETGRLRASRYLRGHTLGTKIVAGQPSPGDEVVWTAP